MTEIRIIRIINRADEGNGTTNYTNFTKGVVTRMARIVRIRVRTTNYTRSALKGRLRNCVEQALGPMGRLRNNVEQELHEKKCAKNYTLRALLAWASTSDCLR